MKLNYFLFLSLFLIFNQLKAQSLPFDFKDVLTEYQLEHPNRPIDTIACKKYYNLALQHIENGRIWMSIQALDKERCEGLLLTDYHIHEYMLWFDSDSIDEDVCFPNNLDCYHITAKKYFYYTYGTDFSSKIKKENDSLNAIDQGYRPAYFTKHKHVYNKMQRIAKYRIDNRSCYGYPNSVRAILTISSDSSIKSILIYRPVSNYSPINHKLTDDDKFAIETNSNHK